MFSRYLMNKMILICKVKQKCWAKERHKERKTGRKKKSYAKTKNFLEVPDAGSVCEQKGLLWYKVRSLNRLSQNYKS